jgi:hypothetical protein
MRRSTRTIFGVLLFALASVYAVAQQALRVAPGLQEFRKNGTKDPQRRFRMEPYPDFSLNFTAWNGIETIGVKADGKRISTTIGES